MGASVPSAMAPNCPPLVTAKSCAPASRQVLVASDARMGEIYVALCAVQAPQPGALAPSVRLLVAPRVERPDAAPAALSRDEIERTMPELRGWRWLLAGDAWHGLRLDPAWFALAGDATGSLGLDAAAAADARDVAELGLAAWQRGEAVDAALAAPRYVRDKVALDAGEQRRLREPDSDWTRTWLVVAIPPVPEATYEESLLVDLYNNTIELVMLTADGTIRHVTWIDKRGAVDVSEPASQLYAGDTAPAIELNGLLGPGTHRLALRSFHQGEPFYSFCHATLSPVPEAADPRARRLVFMNEVEADRSRLTFTVNLPG
mgnify:CR=1 FL=1